MARQHFGSLGRRQDRSLLRHSRASDRYGDFDEGSYHDVVRFGTGA